MILNETILLIFFYSSFSDEILNENYWSNWKYFKRLRKNCVLGEIVQVATIIDLVETYT